MSVALTPDDPAAIDVFQLRVEAGSWNNVAQGLTRILMGYVIIVLGALVGVGMITLAVANLKGANKSSLLAFEAICWVGVSVVILTSVVGYGMIIRGQWSCLKNTPDRHGAKWLMFACMTCLLMGPTLNTAFSYGGVKRMPDFHRGPRHLKMVEFDSATIHLQVASGAVSLASGLLFLGFLRAVARCFGDVRRMARVNLYLLATGLLLGGTVYLAFGARDTFMLPGVLLFLGVGWVVSFFWYLYLLLTIRFCITEGLRHTVSPLS